MKAASFSTSSYSVLRTKVQPHRVRASGEGGDKLLLAKGKERKVSTTSPAPHHCCCAPSADRLSSGHTMGMAPSLTISSISSSVFKEEEGTSELRASQASSHQSLLRSHSTAGALLGVPCLASSASWCAAFRSPALSRRPTAPRSVGAESTASSADISGA